MAWFRTEVDRLLATVQGNVATVPAMADGGLLAGDFYKAIDSGTFQRINDTFDGSPVMKRRTFFGLVGAAAGASLVGTQEASAATAVRIDGNGMLVDLTACIGCRSCEAACAEANGLPAPADPPGDGAAGATRRTTSDRQWVVVNGTETAEGEVFARQQCMHCVEPACTSACLTKALYKTEEGPVIWRADKCMGCRFCMVSCPFDVPKFEYHSANPRIQKCQMCLVAADEGPEAGLRRGLPRPKR